MTKIIYLIICLILFSNFLYCQPIDSTIKKYNDFNIIYSSIGALNSINKELLKENTKQKFLKNNEVKLQQLGSNSNENFTRDYLIDFNKRFTSLKSAYSAQEFLYKSGAELSKYGVEVAVKYVDMSPTKLVTNFITPAVERGFGLYVDNLVAEKITSDRNRLDDLIKNMVNIVYNHNGSDLRIDQNYDSFKNMLYLAVNDMPSMNREDYPIINKELLKYAYKYIAENRDAILLLDLKINNQYDKIKDEFNSKIENLKKEINENTKEEIGKMVLSIESLISNQERTDLIIDEIILKVNQNQSQIKALDHSMKNAQENISRLNDLTKKHDILLSKISFQVDILSGYIFQNLNTSQKIKALESGQFDNIFKDKKEKEDLISKLKNRETVETFVSVASTVSTISAETYNVLIDNNLLKGDDAKRVGNFMYYFQNSLNLGIGAGKLYAGDASGFINILNGVSGFLGKAKKPVKSPEFKMLEEVYKTMSIRFDNIEERLYKMNIKIDTLMKKVYEMNRSMMLSFQIMNNDLNYIKNRTDEIYNMERIELYKSYKCRELEAARQDRGYKLENYSEYEKLYDPISDICDDCLKSMQDFLSNIDDFGFFYFTSNLTPQTKFSGQYEKDYFFTPTKALFDEYYKSNHSLYLNSCKFPVSKINDMSLISSPILKLNLPTIRSGFADEEYLSYVTIIEIASFYLTYGLFYEIKRNNNYRPLPLDTYLTKDTTFIATRKVIQKRKLTKLYNLCDESITQQAITSGHLLMDPLFSILFDGKHNEKLEKLGMNALLTNKILAMNFTSYLLYKKLRVFNLKGQTQDAIDNKNFNEFKKYYIDILNKIDSNKLKAEEDLIKINSLVTLNGNDLKFIYDKTDKKLKLLISRSGIDVNLFVPDPNYILENRMQYTESLLPLIVTRELVYDKLLDVDFTSTLKDIQGSNINWNYYKYLFQKE